MLVRGASATPEGTPGVGTPPVGRKRKHVALEEDGEQASTAAGNDLTSAVQIARDISRPRLTISRHPTFSPSPDGLPYFIIENSAVNRQLDKVGFKYMAAGVADPGAIIPYRTIESKPQCTRVSWEDRSGSIKVTQDGMGLMVDKGFCSARANVGVQEGNWYMEAKIQKGGGDRPPPGSRMEGAYVRIGWGRREAPLNGPVGLDGYSYGVRDKTGDKVTLSRPRRYGKPFGTGDTVGLYISLPPRRQPNPKDPQDPAHIHRERIPIDYKGQEYFESLDYPHSKEMIELMNRPSKPTKPEVPHQSKKSATVKNLPNDRTRNKVPIKPDRPLRELPILPGSKVAFFVNGECQGVAFQDIFDYLQLRPTAEELKKSRDKHRRNKDGPREHTDNHFDDGTLGYYPLFSLFGGAQIDLNPGPDFEYPPPPDVEALLENRESTKHERTWRPMSERYPEFMVQQWELDAREEREAREEADKGTEKARAKEKAKEAREAPKEAHKEAPKEAHKDVSKEIKETPNDAEVDKERLRKDRRNAREKEKRRRKKEEAAAAAAAAKASSQRASEQHFDVSGSGVPLYHPGSLGTSSFTPQPFIDDSRAMVNGGASTRTTPVVYDENQRIEQEEDWGWEPAARMESEYGASEIDAQSGDDHEHWAASSEVYDRNDEIDHMIEDVLPG